jgi:spectinomycin phosphotransferase
MREPPRIADVELRACLRDQYGLVPVALAYLPRGHDYQAGVYRVVDERGAAYLLKVKAAALYEPGCLVPAYLHAQGIAAVVAPVPTLGGALWTTIGEWTAIVYPFHDGDTSLTGMTDAHWREVGSTFRRIHQAPLPQADFASIRRETFDPAEYARWVQTFEIQHLNAPMDGSAAERALRTSWQAHQPTIHAGLAVLERLAEDLRSRPLPLVICHGDLHAANLLRDDASHVYVIDWDDVRLAPKERDFIFVREPEAAAFWDGYGHHAIDWVALAYFRWERVITDAIELARDVSLREDLSEATKTELARVFAVMFSADGKNLAAARTAEARLAGDLGVDM